VQALEETSLSTLSDTALAMRDRRDMDGVRTLALLNEHAGNASTDHDLLKAARAGATATIPRLVTRTIERVHEGDLDRAVWFVDAMTNLVRVATPTTEHRHLMWSAVRAVAHDKVMDLIAALKDPELIPILIDVHARNPTGPAALRARTCVAIGPEATDALVEVLLGDGTPALRASIARTLAELHDTRHCDAFCRTARDPDPKVRGTAIRALGALRVENDQVLATLIEASEDQDDWVRYVAGEAMRQFR
jgi:hypothetical protein